jgi:hypothetical protein
MCLHWTKSEIEKRTEEFFFENLSFNTQKELIRIEKTKMGDILNYIIKIKNFIESSAFNHNHHIEKTDKKLSNYKSGTRYENDNVKPKVKFCRFHKVNTHSDEECFKQKNKG